MYSRQFLEQLYRTLCTIRVFETQCVKLYRQDLIVGYFHPYLGEEAIATGVCAALRDDDYIVSTHRGHGHCIARGGELKKMVAEVLGREDGYCRGRGGSMHIADVTRGNIGANGIVGGGIPIGVGTALGISIRGGDQVVAIFFSDGAANNGVFPESLNMAAIWNLPVVFDYLDAPIEIVAGRNTPIPFNVHLERASCPRFEGARALDTFATRRSYAA